MSAVLVLNADLGPLHRVSLRHAIRMLYRQVAVVHETEGDRRIGPYQKPLTVRLVNYVVTRWRHSKTPPWSRRGVLLRDGRKCAYCLKDANTVDHITPQSRGGKDRWENTVAACSGCNNAKRNRTPAEAGMPLRYEPTAPTWAIIRPRATG